MQAKFNIKLNIKSISSVYIVGILTLFASFILAASLGAYSISINEIIDIITFQNDEPTAAENVFMQIRLPRLIAAVGAGAGLAITGALMQGIFRNPLADPGLIGISSGAALGAAIIIIVGATFFPEMPRQLGGWYLIISAFIGGLIVTALVYIMSQTQSGTQVVLMLLAGIAINALAAAGLGYMSTIATDEQLRSLQFWLLGNLGAASWNAAIMILIITFIIFLLSLKLAAPLNAIALGEAAAYSIGVKVENIKRQAVIFTALCVGVIVSSVGIIGFIGLVAPHLVRMIFGSDHKNVLPACAFCGAVLVLLSDLLARTIAAPAELPLGILTAALGAPFFLWLLNKQRRKIQE